jgi:hypothetical protein
MTPIGQPTFCSPTVFLDLPHQPVIGKIHRNISKGDIFKRPKNDHTNHHKKTINSPCFSPQKTIQKTHKSAQPL